VATSKDLWTEKSFQSNKII